MSFDPPCLGGSVWPAYQGHTQLEGRRLTGRVMSKPGWVAPVRFEGLLAVLLGSVAGLRSRRPLATQCPRVCWQGSCRLDSGHSSGGFTRRVGSILARSSLYLGGSLPSAQREVLRDVLLGTHNCTKIRCRRAYLLLPKASIPNSSLRRSRLANCRFATDQFPYGTCLYEPPLCCFTCSASTPTDST